MPRNKYDAYKGKERDIRILHIFLPREKYSKLLFAAARIIAMFVSTNVCEQFF